MTADRTVIATADFGSSATPHQAMPDQSSAETVRSPQQTDQWLAFLRGKSIQPKLSVSNPDDPEEREADAVADRIMRMEDPAISGTAIASQISRSCSACADEDERIARKPVDWGPSEDSIDNDVSRVLSGGGQPLDPDTHQFMASRFGSGFNDVRIHTGPEAAASATAVGARAYTVGQDIVFGPGQFQPASDTGRRLLAHELTHVVQNSGSGQLSRARTLRRAPDEEKATPELVPTAGDVSKVRDTSKLKPGGEMDVAEGRKFAWEMIRLLKPLGAKVSEPESENIAVADNRDEDAPALQASLSDTPLQRSGGGSVTPEGGFVGSVQVCYDACSQEISVIGWVWAGGGVVTKGLFGGKSWWGAYVFAEGELLKPQKVDFLPKITCGKCDPDCAKKEGGHVDWGGGLAGFPVALKPGEWAKLKQGGIEVGVLVSPHSLCSADVEFIALVDLTKYLGPLGAAVVAGQEVANKLAKRFDMEIECGIGLDVSGSFHLCKSVPGGGLMGVTADSAKICGGGYIGCGIGLAHEKSALPGV